ncbi:hypothetical protein EVAR_7096_1 [Eumeta japonica]|uniref:Uncharacterized protein n=1 Tax=Eumeta variegata TaxID=151549 RepID=A0A4C1YD97_EUMVA|nr:hypothetical protein EVAR_7096_1 [Eumeta japonica]
MQQTKVNARDAGDAAFDPEVLLPDSLSFAIRIAIRAGFQYRPGGCTWHEIGYRGGLNSSTPLMKLTVTARPHRFILTVMPHGSAGLGTCKEMDCNFCRFFETVHDCFRGIIRVSEGMPHLDTACSVPREAVDLSVPDFVNALLIAAVDSPKPALGLKDKLSVQVTRGNI